MWLIMRSGARPLTSTEFPNETKKILEAAHLVWTAFSGGSALPGKAAASTSASSSSATPQRALDRCTTERAKGGAMVALVGGKTWFDASLMPGRLFGAFT